MQRECFPQMCTLLGPPHHLGSSVDWGILSKALPACPIECGCGILRKALPAYPIECGWTILSLLFIHDELSFVHGLVLLVFTVVLNLQPPRLSTSSFAHFPLIFPPPSRRPASRQQRSHLLLFI